MKNKIFTFLALTLPLFIHAHDVEKKPALTLSAQGVLYKSADELQMNIGVVTIKDTAEKALQENNQKMAAIIKSLTEAGLKSKDYETGHFSINPTYTPYPKNPPEDWKQSINGFEVNNTIFIHTTLINSAGILIDAANKAGANNINGINFVLHDPRTYWKEAIALATANAVSDAQELANAASLKLVGILSIDLQSDHRVGAGNAMYAAKSMNYDSAPSIESGDVKVIANVTITYEIAPAN
ncbi:MAG TPA: SIMPL domain-containing protein [Parachlamydiaceae bacterium]|nr:SIMPL domain-containing protein [Parachlamydiaceae bacterium]